MNKHANALALLRAGVRVQQVKQAGVIDTASDVIRGVGHAAVEGTKSLGHGVRKGFERANLPGVGNVAEKAVHYGVPAAAAYGVSQTDTAQGLKLKVQRWRARRRAEKQMRQMRGY